MSEQPRGFYYADVVAVERLTVHMVRVTFGGEHVAGYRTLGVPDECVGVYFPRAGEAVPPPMTEVDGFWWFHGLDDAPEGRNYTIRRLDPERGELTIDFFAPPIDTEVAFAPPPRSATATMLSAAALKKNEEAAESLLLPEDHGYKVCAQLFAAVLTPVPEMRALPSHCFSVWLRVVVCVLPAV